MNRKGFSLIELLVAMVVASIVMASIYAVYRSQTAGPPDPTTRGSNATEYTGSVVPFGKRNKDGGL